MERQKYKELLERALFMEWLEYFYSKSLIGLKSLS